MLLHYACRRYVDFIFRAALYCCHMFDKRHLPDDALSSCRFLAFDALRHCFFASSFDATLMISLLIIFAALIFRHAISPAAR